MPVIGTATTAEYTHLRKRAPEREVTAAEIDGISAVERLRLVELGMALHRCIGSDAVDALDPRLAGNECALEMGRMRAVDQEIFACTLRCGVDRFDRLAQGLSPHEAAIGLDREGDRGGNFLTHGRT